MQSLPHFSAVADRYDAFLLDVWGVVHDGSHLYPGVHDCIERMHKTGKKIIFVSNAPRRSHKVVTVLSQLGIAPSLYDEAISSGELGYQWLEKNTLLGKRYYFIGPGKDADVLDGLDYKRVDDLKDADFLLNVGFGMEEQSDDDFKPLFRAARTQKMPMLCLNPDLEVIKITGERFPCAGVLGKLYEQLGGSVSWFGKPYQAIYDYCLAQLAPIPKSRILAIGDSLETDIPGAQQCGIDAMLVTGGILKGNSIEKIEDSCAARALTPKYHMPQLVW